MWRQVKFYGVWESFIVLERHNIQVEVCLNRPWNQKKEFQDMGKKHIPRPILTHPWSRWGVLAHQFPAEHLYEFDFWFAWEKGNMMKWYIALYQQAHTQKTNILHFTWWSEVFRSVTAKNAPRRVLCQHILVLESVSRLAVWPCALHRRCCSLIDPFHGVHSYQTIPLTLTSCKAGISWTRCCQYEKIAWNNDKKKITLRVWL